MVFPTKNGFLDGFCWMVKTKIVFTNKPTKQCDFRRPFRFAPQNFKRCWRASWSTAFSQRPQHTKRSRWKGKDGKGTEKEKLWNTEVVKKSKKHHSFCEILQKFIHLRIASRACMAIMWFGSSANAVPCRSEADRCGPEVPAALL